MWAQGGARAEAPLAPAIAEAPRVLTNYHDFWLLEGEARLWEHAARFEADVLFYDPEWNVLWMENEDLVFFCPTGGRRHPIRAGQRVLLECRVKPEAGFDPQDLRFTVLGPARPRVALDANERLDRDPQSLSEQFVKVTGLVERTTEDDPTHLRLWMIAEGRLLAARVLVGTDEPLPELVGRVVEATGLLAVQKSADGLVQRIDLWVPGLRAVRDLGPLSADPRWALAPSTGAQLRAGADGAVVLVRGEVRAVQPGQSLTLWDESDQVQVLSPQAGTVRVGEAVTAVGRLEKRGLDLVLRAALWRRETDGDAMETGPRNKLRRAAQVMELAPTEAARGHSVDLWGVVTWTDPAGEAFYIQDATRGVRVRLGGKAALRPPIRGDSVRVRGVTVLGGFAPEVRCEELETGGAFTLPGARVITLDQAWGGAEEGLFVELRGYAGEFAPDGAGRRLRVSTATGEFSVWLPPAEAPVALAGAVVRVRGVCAARTDDRGHLVAIEVLLAGLEDIVVEEPPLADPFAVARSPLASLRRFGPLQSPYHRVCIGGVVTLVEPGARLVVQEEAIGLEVFVRDTAGLAVGDAVEAVGFPGRQSGRVVLLEARVRRAPTEPVPPPAVAELPAELDPLQDNRLVRASAVVDEVLVGEQELTLLLKDGARRHVARLAGPAGPAAEVRRGSEVECTGVYRIEYDRLGRAHDFRLDLRSAADLRVRRSPPWFTRTRALVGLAALALAGSGALGWVVLLRRQVRAQTRQIRAQLEHQAKLEAELQKAAKLESLGLLAGGIAHDFNNLLTVVMGNITLAMLEEEAMAAAGDCLRDAERGAQRARDLTHQLLTFAKGGDPLRAAEVLPEIVREAAEFVLRGSAVKCDYDFEPGLWPASVDRGQIGQVVHNLVLNAMQAMPQGGLVRVRARNVVLAAGEVGVLPAGRHVQLILADTGPGMAPAVLAKLFDPYFTTKKSGSGLGLATVHSIVRRHHGHIEVQSEVGHGTVFRLWLPAAEEMAAPAAPAEPAAPAQLSGRVLVMDDEEDIRRLVVALLRRLGLEPVAVADGAAAVRAYAEARDEGRPFALVIMDLTVPGGMGGREAMEQLRWFDPQVRAIVSSGYSNDPVLADFRAHGFRGMVEKPYEVERLMECIGRVLAEPA